MHKVRICKFFNLGNSIELNPNLFLDSRETILERLTNCNWSSSDWLKLGVSHPNFLIKFNEVRKINNKNSF